MKPADRHEHAALSLVTEIKPGGARQRLRLGELLVQQGVLTPEQLESALAERKRSGRRLGRILVEDGIATEDAIAQALAVQLQIPYLQLTAHSVTPAVSRLLTEAQSRRFRAIPIEEAGSAIRVGMADPLDYQSYDEIQRILGRHLDLVVVTESRLDATLDKLHSRSEEISGLARELEQELQVGTSDDEPALSGALDDAPVAKLLQSLFDDALRSRASDIHVEPQERKLQIRFRIDGALMMHTEAESRIAPAVVQRLKLLAGLDIAERRLPQDGRFMVRVRGHALDLRMATMPTQYGESVVLRLLPHDGGLLDLDRLGMTASILAKVSDFISLAQGMLLVTGPTGSGKTTTLYGALARMNSPDAKIITAEDPIEYRLPGITQVQVNEKIGLGFATVLRSTLRADPDIVLVGEMRDKDTVETGLRAAMTGHMVLSTLHTNDAASTPMRLLDMGAPRYLIATSLRLVLAQRLVRAICANCARPYAPSAQESAFLQTFGATGSGPLAQGAGCPQCNGTGYLGRMGAYELLEMTRGVVAAFNGGDTQAYMDAASRQIGNHSLAHNVCELVLAGRTTVGEAMRLVGRSNDAS
ncbi:MAG: Flp pilus assembly complex ATPase component TadA [Burkholderiaceae bacterium]|nr:Flp pilus assembly complex ATPase component TadA [Burkholderiaceae bacterium]